MVRRKGKEWDLIQTRLVRGLKPVLERVSRLEGKSMCRIINEGIALRTGVELVWESSEVREKEGYRVEEL